MKKLTHSHQYVSLLCGEYQGRSHLSKAFQCISHLKVHEKVQPQVHC